MMTLQTKLLIAIGLLLAGFATGWQVHGWKYDAAESNQIKQDIKQGAKIAEESAPIITKRDEAKDNTVIVYRTIKERINAEPDNRVCFTNDSLSMWNDAIAGADSDRSKPAEKADTVEATATVREVLNNAADNFETCNLNSLDHNALIDKVESLKGKMCVCNGSQ